MINGLEQLPVKRLPLRMGVELIVSAGSLQNKGCGFLEKEF